MWTLCVRAISLCFGAVVVAKEQKTATLHCSLRRTAANLDQEAASYCYNSGSRLFISYDTPKVARTGGLDKSENQLSYPASKYDNLKAVF
ncbi:hypothetical protein PENARI_c018G07193 [Penicillium arizonense]|uniref:Uncharacterized protein n=1 Tax=Penicillium arizonense TaxID=1835702 RepID=A0A1F5LA89_PENAI|nr:hypothetical protein PENARI_c018G07193 [Penicillium arizonense]OGE50148.1 hypothetical protein PENARI_c018G07193 [Penicillium arizonense]